MLWYVKKCAVCRAVRSVTLMSATLRRAQRGGMVPCCTKYMICSGEPKGKKGEGGK